ncbi:MAG: type 4a pilus biogenesis protein PilO [Gammaproteobacteria bacterium]
MALSDSLKSLQEIQLSDLTLDNVGSWPLPIKVVAWIAVFGAVLFLGYNYHLKDLQAQADQVRAQEDELRRQFEAKAFQVANLDALRAQLAEMEQQFGALLGQLPKDTEVPGLLEDITEKGVDAGLRFSSIALQAERAAEFYVELPIDINVTGSYHDLGAFASGVAGLSRIVTLHDFRINPGANSAELNMQILAKTYRYKGEE